MLLRLPPWQNYSHCFFVLEYAWTQDLKCNIKNVEQSQFLILIIDFSLFFFFLDLLKWIWRNLAQGRVTGTEAELFWWFPDSRWISHPCRIYQQQQVSSCWLAQQILISSSCSHRQRQKLSVEPCLWSPILCFWSYLSCCLWSFIRKFCLRNWFCVFTSDAEWGNSCQKFLVSNYVMITAKINATCSVKYFLVRHSACLEKSISWGKKRKLQHVLKKKKKS